MIHPMLHHMTSSELHAVMTSGFATIAGCIMAGYILFGVSNIVNTFSYTTVLLFNNPM